jgi:ATP-dependent DNA ligase
LAGFQHEFAKEVSAMSYVKSLILPSRIKGRAGLLFAEQIQGSGIELFQAICARDLEGIVAKHRLGPYAETPVTWFKIVNDGYSQKRGRREMFDKFRERLHVTA